MVGGYPRLVALNDSPESYTVPGSYIRQQLSGIAVYENKIVGFGDSKESSKQEVLKGINDIFWIENHSLAFILIAGLSLRFQVAG